MTVSSFHEQPKGNDFVLECLDIIGDAYASPMEFKWMGKPMDSDCVPTLDSLIKRDIHRMGVIERLRVALVNERARRGDFK